MNSKVTIIDDVSMNSKLWVLDDVSLNNRLYVGNDTSFNWNVDISGHLAIGKHPPLFLLILVIAMRFAFPLAIKMTDLLENILTNMV